MKIAFVTDGLFPDVIGGMQKYSAELIRAFAETGADVDVYIQKPATRLEEEFHKYSNIHFVTLPVRENGILPGKYLRQLKEFSKEAFNRIRSDGNAQIIYAQGFTGWFAGNSEWQENSHPPVFLNLHGLEMFQAARGIKAKLIQWYFRRFVFFMLKKQNSFIALGEKLKQILLNENSELHVYIIPNGVHSNAGREQMIAGRDGTKTKFLFVGRYEWRKGLDTLNKALEQFLKRGIPNWEMHFVGDIPPPMQISSGQIFYHGATNDPHVIAGHYRNCDVLVCPSYSEGMPTVILEAMAEGLAIVATDVGAVAELVNADNGILLEPFDENALFQAMSKMTEEHESALRSMKLSGQNRVFKEFAWSSIAQKHLEIFRTVLNGG